MDKALIQLFLTIAYAEVDYPGIGHFTTHDFYDEVYRPVVVLPESPEHIKVRFMSYTRSNAKNEEYLNYNNHNSIKNSHFNGSNPTKFIVHGFVDSQDLGPYMKEMKDQFLAVYDDNVIIVDWSGGNGLPYAQVLKHLVEAENSN